MPIKIGARFRKKNQPLIFLIFHFHYFREGESYLNNVYFYNDNNAVLRAE